MTDVRLLPEAEFDLAEAALFLQARVRGLGDQFADEIYAALARLADNPSAGEEIRLGIRKLLVRRFPYSVIYRILPDHVLVLAIAHHSRRPGYWRRRG